ncbi:MAG TPA: POTRA domain-containing protein, partial [Kofleriaceae bacterium]
MEFEGNHRIRDKSLLTGLGVHRILKRGGSPDPYTIQLDADRIRGEYLRKGYLEVGVTTKVERKGDDTTVTYTVEEGPRALTRFRITGLPPEVKPETVAENFKLKDGQPFDYEQFDLAKPTLLGAVQDAGYARAKLDADVVADRATRTATISLDYTPGPKSKFGQYKISGVKGELAEAVENRLEFHPGQQYSTQAIVQSQRNLYGFGRFSTVQVKPDASMSDTVGVEVAVSESARHEIQFGGGFGIEPEDYEVRGRAGYSIAGWPWPLDTVSVDLRPAYAYIPASATWQPRIKALVKFERKDLGWTYTKSTIEAGFNYITIEPWTSYGPFGRLGFETPVISRRVTFRIGWGIEYTQFRDFNDLFYRTTPSPYGGVSSDVPERIGVGKYNAATNSITGQNERAAAFMEKLVVDLRDNPIEPNYGAYGEVSVSEGNQVAGSNFNYTEIVPDVRGYAPIAIGVLAARFRYGAIYGDVPPTERFFGGGSISQRGFGERHLSPNLVGTDDQNSHQVVPYGGAGQIDTSIEARIPITKVYDMPLGFVTFLDGGDVTEK